MSPSSLTPSPGRPPPRVCLKTECCVRPSLFFRSTSFYLLVYSLFFHGALSTDKPSGPRSPSPSGSAEQPPHSAASSKAKAAFEGNCNRDASTKPHSAVSQMRIQMRREVVPPPQVYRITISVTLSGPRVPFELIKRKSF